MLGGFTRMKTLNILFRIGGWGAIAGASVSLIIAAVAYFAATTWWWVAGVASVGNFALGGFLFLIARLTRPQGEPTSSARHTA
jgi:hypothetical protein